MNDNNNRFGLGKGLSALIPSGDDCTEFIHQHSSDIKPYFLPIKAVFPGVFQPRQVFCQEELENLADSIKSNGIINPILVRVCDQDSHKYEIIAGERRWRAGIIAGLREVPVIVRDLSDKAAIEVAIIENIQREDLNAIEEAEAYRKLIEQYFYTHDDLSGIVGKSRSHITNMIRLLSLPKEVKVNLKKNKITMGHARAMVGMKNVDFILNQILEKSLNVRQTESLIKNLRSSNKIKGDFQVKQPDSASKGKNLHACEKGPVRNKGEDLVALERKLSDKFGLTVEIAEEENGGAVSISYNSLVELELLLEKLISCK